MIRKLPKIFFSYSFSFSSKFADDLRYYKRTTHGHTVNSVSEEFVLNFIKNVKPLDNDSKTSGPKRGRPKRKVKDDKMYVPFNFSFRISTIDVIHEYKNKHNMPNLDVALENHLKTQIPVRKK